MENIVRLKAIEEDDLWEIREWRNSKNVMPYCRQYRPLSTQDMHLWYDSLCNDTTYNLTNDLFLIINNSTAIGVCGLVRLDWRNRKGEVSFYVGDDTYRTKEIISKTFLLLMEYAFKTLNLHKIYFPVYSFNPYLSIYEEILKREYTAKEEYYWEGKFHDRVILVAYESK